METMNLLAFLRILVDVLIVIVLYNVRFIVVEFRKITRRIEGITEELEIMILKPLSLTDKAFEWVADAVEKKGKKSSKKKKSTKTSS